MFMEDLSIGADFVRGPNVRAVGWLEAGHPYQQGSAPDGFLAQLKEHMARAYQPMLFWGFHECTLCADGQRRTGCLNLLIPTSQLLYVAPEMIVHYVEEHGYRPPLEFVDAVMACPEQESPRYMALLGQFQGSWGLR